MVNTYSDVFVTDGHWRKTLAAVRALGQNHIRVTVGESTRLSMAAFSRYCHRQTTYPSPRLSSHNFLDFMHDLLAKKPFRMLLPMEEDTTYLLSGHLDTFSRLTYLPIPPKDKLTRVRNKANIIRLAEQLGIPVPRTWHIQDLSQLDGIANILPYPVVIKPQVSSGAVGVAYPKNQKELKKTYQTIHQQFPFPMIQEFIPREGNGYGASFLFDEQSSLKAGFVHKRLREYPVTGGASTLRVSIRHDDIYDMARTLLEKIGWFGVAMVEFKVDPRDGLPKLMEINPRFWGSLSLAIHAGVNFPLLLHKMAMGEHFDPVETYRSGIACRWLIPGDLLHFIFNPNRSRIMHDFFRFNARNTFYDILSTQDPIPAIIKILSPLTFLYDADMKARMRTRRDVNP
ncbi:MAG: ATP-grasp domain-containing protein [Desulfobacterales bacterium]|nr:ATP-grasp domain-containing protein [Desulfobacterales bacterium]MDX2512024.1 ATP-grasp domain-containing protein [Desulfobacterales bacterium]